MNLIPFVSSNLWAARMRPRLPLLMRSASDTPWFWYFFATDTTNRRLLRTSLSNASSSPTRMRCARLTSSSCGISGYLLISRRYWSSEPSSNDGPRLPAPTCIGRMRLDLVLIWGFTRNPRASREHPSAEKRSERSTSSGTLPCGVGLRNGVGDASRHSRVSSYKLCDHRHANCTLFTLPEHWRLATDYTS